MGICPSARIGVRAPRVRDRVGQGEARIRFLSAILPPYARRSKSLEVLIPILDLKGISTGDFEEALAALLRKDAGGLSASTARGSKTLGSTSMCAGRSVILLPSAMSTFGLTGSTFRLG
jgi:hypothetical protein